MELTYNGSYGPEISPERDRSAFGPGLGIHIFGASGGSFEGHANAPAIFAEEARWRAQAWADYMPGQPNPFVR